MRSRGEGGCPWSSTNCSSSIMGESAPTRRSGFDDVQPHVVAVPFLTQGHINPLMHFCLKLAANGIRVTFVEILVQGAQFLKGPKLAEQEEIENFRFDSIPLELPEGFTLDGDGARVFFQALEDLEAPFEQLMQRLSSEKPRVRCVISDCMFKWTQDVAKRFGIPRVGFWTAALAALSVDYHVPLLMANGDIPITESNKNKLVSYIPGLSPLRAFDVPCIYHADNFMTTSDPGYQRKIARSVILKDDAWVIANSFEELEPDVFDALRREMNDKCIGVGPLLPPAFLGLEQESAAHPKVAPGVASMWKQDMDCLKWLDTQAPNSVLYISFGSAVVISDKEFQVLAEGLEASQQAFLWALRPNSVVKISQDALESFTERTKSRSMVISWAPQVEVLSHASTGAFLTHCGWNSVLEGICGGVPMLGWPREAEQNLNCKLLVDDMKVGLRLLDDSWSTTKDEIAHKVTSILNDHEMRERVGKLKNAARRSVTEGASSQVNLQAFIYDIKELAATVPKI